MDSTPLRNMSNLQAALANAFCYLITSMDDSNVYVAQRATLYLGTIHDTAIRVNLLSKKIQLYAKKIETPFFVLPPQIFLFSISIILFVGCA